MSTHKLAPVCVGISFLLFMSPLFFLSRLITDQNNQLLLSDFGIECEPSSLTLTTLYVFLSVFIQITVGVSSALAVFLCSRKNHVILISCITVMTIPYAIPSSICYVLLEFLVGHGGTLQRMLFASASPLDGTWARFFSLTVLSAWQFTPQVFLVVLASFLSMPNEVIRTAEADGATPAKITTHFLLPAALPVIFGATVLRVILMTGKLDTPLIFTVNSSNDYACVAAVQIYSSVGIGGSNLPIGLVLTLVVVIAIQIALYYIIMTRRES
jgi:multiple sugar transport system permease protein